MLQIDEHIVKAFFELLKAGLFPVHGEGVMVHDSLFKDVDWEKVFQLAQEQSVQGLLLQGIEELKAKGIELSVPKVLLLQWIGEVQVMEQRNKEMNTFVADLIEKLRKNDIYTLLVKGQGIAQCYEKPLWRAAGDVDLYLSKDNYEKAKVVLIPLAQHIEVEDKNKLHLGMTIEGWIVELHGTMHTYISRRINKVNDEVHRDIFFNGNVRSWNDNGVQVFLPSANNDAIIVFNHFINHFYGEGIGLRQICDWSRLLWYYKSKFDLNLLERRIRKAGLMTEWKAFAAFAIGYLGMPDDAMPFFDNRKIYRNKADKIAELIVETGYFGNNKDYNYRQNDTKWKVYVHTFITRMGEFGRLTTVFPLNAPKFFVTYTFNRVKSVL